MKRILVSIVFLAVSFTLFAQSAGDNIYDFLNLPNTARASSLGGAQVSIVDDDLNLAYYNPALLNSSMSDHITLNYGNHFSVNYGYVAYALDYDSIGVFGAGLHYVNYGKFVGADENGIETNEFSASDYALNLFWSKQIDSLFSIGATLKPVYSVLENYTSFGLLADIGATYYNEKKELSLGLVAKNFGRQLKHYTPGNNEPVPFEVQLGITKKLAHAPFRFSILATHLEKYNLQYEKQEDESGSIIADTSSVEPSKFDNTVENTLDIGDNLLRHLIIGVEFLPTKNFAVRLGYNFKRRKEMTIATKSGMVGISFGFGFKISKFHFSYARSSYHLAGGTNMFSISTNLNDFYKKVSAPIVE